ncbi:MAG: hypothetical protein J0L95_02755 [Candidatus Accumulibacter sp.]|uniref:hypothetical protein n=1 Tax=Accumulibacter sp. TaxID=2053492 RepID=UPI001AC67F49|nr:hypothetical protein [Accumulibacter sp.]MBN8436956.1 hypothetical protein [Accumulibacter sp.]
MSREAMEEYRINFERSLFDYWLKVPTWCARDAAILLEMRTSQDHLYGEADDFEVDAMIIGLLRHFQRFGLIDRIGRNSDDYLEVPNTKLPPSEWIKCYRDYPDAKPLHFGKVAPFDAKESELPPRPPIPERNKAAIDLEREEKIARTREEMREDEKGLFDYWRKMPCWEPYDAIYLLTYRVDPLAANSDLAHMMSLAMLPLADHFRLFGLIDSFSVELDGLHVEGNKHTPREWIACYYNLPGAAPLPYDDQAPALPSKPAGTIERAHISNKLAMLNQAAATFWANADREDRGTHPKNADVVAWLMEREYSKSLADSAATIIRPDWAPSGRKPEE